VPTLDAGSRPVELGGGYRLTAPGIRGTATAHAGLTPGTRAPGLEDATEALNEALRQTEVTEVQLVEIDVTAAAPPAPDEEVRTPGGEEGLVLEVPDLGETVGQVVLAIDEDGAMSWNFPVDAGGSLETPDVRGPGQTKRFVIRRVIPPVEAAGYQPDRGLIGMVGQKLLKVLVYPVTDPLLGKVGRHFAAAWEGRNRPYGTRRFDDPGYRQKGVGSLTADDWVQLASGPSLWFVHGTFSTSHGGFYRVPPDMLAELHRLYEGKVAAFDHPSLSVDPVENAAQLSQFLPDGVEMTMDVIAHSRGGLVARAMAGEPSGALPGITVRKAVLVGTPNHGTALASPDHMMELLDRTTTLLNVIPPGPASVVTEVLEAVITAVKVLGHAALKGLPGLASMDPGGEFLTRFNAGASTGATYYAVAADFEPGGGLRSLARQARNLVMDRVFEDAANDLVVPTAGVFEGSTDPGFPIPPERRLQFDRATGIDHGGYFDRPEVASKLREWLAS
jgi:hypothetical protein